MYKPMSQSTRFISSFEKMDQWLREKQQACAIQHGGDCIYLSGLSRHSSDHVIEVKDLQAFWIYRTSLLVCEQTTYETMI